jgi:hypothetical protein
VETEYGTSGHPGRRSAYFFLVAHCHLGLGKLYRRTGEPAKAEEHLSTAMTMYRGMDMGFWLEQIETMKREHGA